MSTRHVGAATAASCILAVFSGSAFANCTDQNGSSALATVGDGSIVNCDANAPNPFPTGIGSTATGINIRVNNGPGSFIEPANVNETGITLNSLGVIQNEGSTRSVNGIAIDFAGGTGSFLFNTGSGVVTAGGDAVNLGSANRIENGSGASILSTGGAAVNGSNNNRIDNFGFVNTSGGPGLVLGNSNDVTNFGGATIQSTAAPAILFVGSGNELVNQAGGLISGNPAGVTSSGGNLFDNFGIVNGVTNGFALNGDGDTLTNAAGGEILSSAGPAVAVNGNGNFVFTSGTVNSLGSDGIQINGNGNTIAVPGQVTGGGGNSINFVGGTNSLVLGTGSDLVGTAVGGGTETLTLQGTGSENDTFQNFETLIMDGDSWTLPTDQVFNTLNVNRGTLTILANFQAGTAATVNDGGTFVIAPGARAVTPAGMTVNSGGAMRVNGIAEPGAAGLTINSSGFLDGNGLIQGNLNNSGVTAPGNSIGTLTVNGDFTQTSSGILRIEVDSSGNTDKLVVNGTANLGGTVQIAPLAGGPGFVPNVVFDTFLTSTAANGNFATVTGQPGLADRITGGSALVGGNVRLFTISPANQDAYSNAVVQNGYTFMSNLTGRGHGSHGAGAGSTAMVPGSNMVAASTFSGPLGLPGARAAAKKGQWSGWIKGVGAFGDTDPSDGVAGYDHQVLGLQGGGDMGLNDNTVLGGGVAFTRTESDIDQNGGDVEIDSFMFGGYLGWDKGIYFADAALGGGYNDYESKRNILTNTASAQARGSFDGWTFGARLQGGAEFGGEDDWKFRPVVTGDYIYASQGSYTESGAGAGNLRFNSDDVQAVRLSLFGALSKSFDNNGNTVVPEVRVGAVYENALDNRRVNGSNPVVGPFTLQGRTRSDQLMGVGGGVSYYFSENKMGYVDYQGEFGSRRKNNTVSAGLRFTF